MKFRANEPEKEGGKRCRLLVCVSVVRVYFACVCGSF